MNSHPALDSEATIDGARTESWTLDGPDCPELKVHRIARVGIVTARAQYTRVRLRPAGSFFLASLEGEGAIFLEGRWQRAKAGSLCMAPPRVLNAFHAVPGKQWVFAWVRYEEPAFVKPLVGASSPLKLRNGAEQFGRALLGLRDEWEGNRDPKHIHHWVMLVHSLAIRATKPWNSGPKIGEVWELVSRELATEWKLTTLAKRCSLSAEHLRRLCLRELGRTPMEHLTYIRVQRAQELLETTDEKVESIASQIGYRSAHVFSRAFARCVGMTPSEYRSRR